ncbi:FxsA family protein [Microbispora hainanensis]|uniref:FxsA family protein n=1 Tax=Microbispora hainanensis TaxID=568844 RepID=A0A544YXG7_9ACTN|nr:FxsA family protein [Microbispora hainanensis]TQS21438.1 FxsA family protein [Microbispora hainanensis]
MVRIGLFLAFLVIPVLEIWFLIQVGSVIGGWETVALLIADSILGAWLVRREGRRAWAALRSAIESGRMPDKELADGALIVAGGALLMTPGFLSDVFGFFMILPFTRPIARRWVSWFLGRRVRSLAARSPYAPLFDGTPGFGRGAGFDEADGFRGPAAAGRGRVVHGEVVDDD